MRPGAYTFNSVQKISSLQGNFPDGVSTTFSEFLLYLWLTLEILKGTNTTTAALGR